jgi:choline dehydrogenase-like flavoprotein
VIVGRGLDQADDFITITVSHLKPRSRGALTLASADPSAAPRIRVNYLSDPHDVDVLIESVALARRLRRCLPPDSTLIRGMSWTRPD